MERGSRPGRSSWNGAENGLEDRSGNGPAGGVGRETGSRVCLKTREKNVTCIDVCRMITARLR